MSLRSAIRTIFTLGHGAVGGLSEETAGTDPIALFKTWFDAAKRSTIFLPETMTVATATKDGVPSARMMLLKGVDQDGFVFFTNYQSRKATELDENPRAALVFHWAILERQVRVEGTLAKLPTEASAAYFHSRARGSQIGAWASEQSRPLARREDLERREREHRERFEGVAVPLPPFWGGYRVTPVRIEFWQGRLNRLHDRLRFDRQGAAWQVTRLFP
ncbi:MAG TPA: pyridoxamine 5'-phosphate oxidase [Gemmatimonadales bacterium]